jgi:AmiR/NasT family two-component response regulator
MAARLDLQEMTATQSDRAEIGMAQGLLMAEHKLTPAGALELLRVRSLKEHRRIRDLARDMLHDYAKAQADQRHPHN